MNGGTQTNNWDNKWNQTADLTIDNENSVGDMYALNDDGWSAGYWSLYLA